MLIAVVIPAHNAAPWIGGAIASVLAQSHRALCLAVVDDGSTDATASIVSGFPDSRLRLIRQDRQGVSAARNRGAAAMDADAVLFLDADDLLAPDALARLAAALAAEPNAVAATGACALRTERGASIGRLRARRGDLLIGLLERNLFANCGQLLIHATALRRAGGFREDIRYGEDWEFLIRLALSGKFAAAPGQPTLFVCRRGAGAYLDQAKHLAAFDPCMAAIFGNPALVARLGPRRLASLRVRTEAENQWITGRALMALGNGAEARAWLRRSLAAKPSLARLALTLAAHAPPAARRYFMGENAVGNSNVECISTSIGPP